MSEKNTLVKMSPNQVNPYNASASDFKAVGAGKKGFAEGTNQHLSQSAAQMGPGRNEDSGDMTPSVAGKGGSAFKVSQAAGGEAGTNVKWDHSVDRVSGKMVCKGYKPTRVGEVDPC